MEGRREALASIENEIIGCRACPRLVAWREQVAKDKRAAYADQEYWGRPVPGFGDPEARMLIVGLAPAAHGGNRTGRVFTGDRSGDWLFGSLHRTGWANQATSVSVGDGLELRGAWVSATVRCAPPANKPTTDEFERCFPFLVREAGQLGGVRVVVALGGDAWRWSCRLLGIGPPRPQFGHGREATGPGGTVLLGSYHPSQQNTFTGRLTTDMLDGVFHRAREVAGLDA